MTVRADVLRIAVTPERPCLPGEPALIGAVLDAGWHRVHLRHPGATAGEMRRLIEAVEPRHRTRLRLHDLPELALEFDLGGLHLNGRMTAVPAGYEGAVSRTCHSIAEVLEADAEGRYDYLTLSPIFDSVSKRGYRGAFSGAELEMLAGTATPVIALGGVTPERTGLLKRYNFAGYATLGALPWGGSVDEMRRQLMMFNQWPAAEPKG